MAATKGAFRAGRVVTPDAKWTGDEPDWHNWEKLTIEQFLKRRSRMIGFYSYYLVAEDLVPDLVQWMQSQGYSKANIQLIKDAPNGLVSFTMMKFARCFNRGMPAQHPEMQSHWEKHFPSGDEEVPVVAPNDFQALKNEVDSALLKCKEKVVIKTAAVPLEEKKPVGPTIQEKIILKAEREVISKLDEIHDLWSYAGDTIQTISATSLVRDSGLPEAGCKYVVDWIEKARLEYVQAFEKTCSQMVEGYSHLSKKGLRVRIQALDKMIDEVNKVMATKKAHKKTRAKKPKDASKQVKYLKFQPDSQEFSLTSVNPERIPTSYQVVLFSTKYRTLSFCQASGPAGIEVKGSGLKGFDPAASFTTTLRKPSEVLNGVMNATPKKISQVFDRLKTTRRPFNGRVNDKMIIVRVIEQKAA